MKTIETTAKSSLAFSPKMQAKLNFDDNDILKSFSINKFSTDKVELKNRKKSEFGDEFHIYNYKSDTGEIDTITIRFWYDNEKKMMSAATFRNDHCGGSCFIPQQY